MTPWSAMKLLIVEAVEAGAETTDEIREYAAGRGASVSRATMNAHLNRALKERAIACSPTCYKGKPFEAAPISTAGMSEAEWDAARMARRETFLGLES